MSVESFPEKFPENASNYAKVIWLIEHEGPISVMEIWHRIGGSRSHIRAWVGEFKHQGRCRISSWRRDDDGGHLYLRALYTASRGPDAPRPPPLSSTEYNRRYRRRQKGVVASVFTMATPVSERRVGRAADRRCGASV